MTNKLIRHVVACWDSEGNECLVRYTTEDLGEDELEKELRAGLDAYGFELYPNINKALWVLSEGDGHQDTFVRHWEIAHEPD